MDPVFKEAIWGGTKLRDVFDYEIPSDTTGECWAISGHANGMSHVAGGRFDGKYQDISIVQHKGQITKIENTLKYKFPE